MNEKFRRCKLSGAILHPEMIIQTFIAGLSVEGTACVSETNDCNVRSEEFHVPYCTATVMAVTAECVYVYVYCCLHKASFYVP